MLSMKFEIHGVDRCWTVDARDDITGDQMATIFYGANAVDRARAYVAWMNEPREIGEQMYAIRNELKAISSSIVKLRQHARAPEVIEHSVNDQYFKVVGE